ncbi:MAG: PorP/SprF family type IX secretion system membrane protein [Bacteroidia bacterium]
MVILRKIKLLLTSGVFLMVTNVVAQDIHFSQFNNAPLSMNPALTGDFDGQFRAIINYKQQWLPYTTYAASFDFKNLLQNSPRVFLAPGLSIYDDKAGDAQLGLMQANLSLASGIHLDLHNDLALGFEGGFAQRSLSLGSLTWDNQFDGVKYNSLLPSGEHLTAAALNYLDFGTGLDWRFYKPAYNSTSHDALSANLGISYSHFNKPNISFYSSPNETLYPKLVVHGTATFDFKNSNGSLVPAFYYASQGPSTELTIGTGIKTQLKMKSLYTGYVRESSLMFAGYYRIGDSFIFLTQLELKNIGFGVSYDFNFSDYEMPSPFGMGGLEISLKYIVPTLTHYTHRGSKAKL